MMFRRHIINELSSYLDNQLSGKQRLLVEKHLKVCKFCSQELERLKMLSAQLKEWNAPGLDAGFDSVVKGKIVRWELERGQVKMKKRALAIVIPSSILAGILVFVFLNVVAKQGMQGRIRSTVDQIGDQYSPGYTGHTTLERQRSTGNYEPYYFSREVSPKEGEDRKIKLAKGDKDYNLSTVTGGLRSSVSSKPVQVAKGEYVPYTEEAQEVGGESGGGTVIVIQPSIPATGVGEKIIRTGVIKLEVEDGKDTYKAASQICQELGGYLAASDFYKDREGRQAGTITMRIPKDKFTTALDRLSALGKVENINTDSQDVSQEYANLQSQLDAAMVVYKKVLEALEKRQNTIPQAMRLESELTPILKRVQDLKTQIEYLNNAVSFTTVTVDFHESRVSVKALKESKRFIQESMIVAAINTVKFLAAALPIAILGAVLLVIATVTIMVIKYWVIRLFKRE